MAMYAITVTGEWGASDGRLLLGRVTCEFAAEGSGVAMETASGALWGSMLAALFTPQGQQQLALWQSGQRPEATLDGVLAVHVRRLRD